MLNLMRVDNALALALILLLPLVWVGSRGLIQALGPPRAWIALAVRSILMLLLILAISEPYWVKKNDQLSVLFLVDRSSSVSNERIDQTAALIAEQLRARQQSANEERVGVLGFGREPVVEVPVDGFGLNWQGDFGTRIESDQTDIQSALELAHAILPGQGARRVVVVTDGAETVGEALPAASRLASDGIGIDAIALADERMQDIVIEKLDSPPRVRPSAPFDIKVVVRFATNDSAEATRGQLDVIRVVDGSEQLMASQSVELEPGTNIFTFREQIDVPGFYSYRARFTPETRKSDRFERNNIAESFVQVAGGGRVLLVVEPGRAGEFDWVVDLLEREKIEVDVQPTPLSIGGLADFQSYDVVLLADVPRYLDGDASTAPSISDASLELMRQATESTGCGLLVIGGTQSFGNGDWKDTPVEQAMPVSFDVKNMKVQASTALELVIDSSGSMDGQKIQLCRMAAREAVRNLKPFDYIGVISFDSAATEIVKLQKASARELISQRISRLAAGGGTNMYPALQQAFYRLRSSPASVKHVLLMTDGQTQGSGYVELARQMQRMGITVSCMAIGNDADQNLLSSVAAAAGGQFYKVVTPTAIPRIVISETRRIARPLIYEYPAGFSPSLGSSHPIVDSIADEFPPLTGFVLTTPKENPLVQTLIRSPVPVGEDYPVLATWQYGLGRSAAWTTDAGQRWSSSWAGWESRQKLFLQLIRWLMRTDAPNDRAQLVSNVVGDRAELLLTGLTESGEPWNNLFPVGIVVPPNGETERVSFSQIGPGRYRAFAEANEFGTHIVSVNMGSEDFVLRSAFTKSYSEEFRIDGAGRNRLEQLASLQPAGGKPGAVVEISNQDSELESLPVDFFRPGLSASPSETVAWPVLLFCAALLLLVDVFNRRVAWTGLGNLVTNRREQQAERETRPQPPTAAVSARPPNVESRFEPPAESLKASDVDTDPVAGESPQPVSKAAPGLSEDSGEELGYTERLKRAKDAAGRRR